jgi:hypothetical protein
VIGKYEDRQDVGDNDKKEEERRKRRWLERK